MQLPGNRPIGSAASGHLSSLKGFTQWGEDGRKGGGERVLLGKGTGGPRWTRYGSPGRKCFSLSVSCHVADFIASTTHPRGLRWQGLEKITGAKLGMSLILVRGRPRSSDYSASTFTARGGGHSGLEIRILSADARALPASLLHPWYARPQPCAPTPSTLPHESSVGDYDDRMGKPYLDPALELGGRRFPVPLNGNLSRP